LDHHPEPANCLQQPAEQEAQAGQPREERLREERLREERLREERLPSARGLAALSVLPAGA
jgi:hypothetical protein